MKKKVLILMMMVVGVVACYGEGEQDLGYDSNRRLVSATSGGVRYEMYRANGRLVMFDTWEGVLYVLDAGSRSWIEMSIETRAFNNKTDGEVLRDLSDLKKVKD